MKEYVLHDSLGFLVAQASRLMALQLGRNFREAGYSVTVEQWRVLVQLWEKDGQNQQDLSAKCGKDKTSVTRLIDAMEKSGIVVRVPDQKDRRNKLIYLTHHGKTLKKELVELSKKTLSEAKTGIDRKDINGAKKVLEAIYNNLQATAKPE